MNIKFLGTSAGWPLPRLGCNCQICTSKDPKDKRTRTQILIDNKVLLDAGPDTYHHLINLPDLSKLKAVLISHAHPDHILGLWDLPHIYGRKESGLDKINIYVTQPVLNEVRKFLLPYGKLKPVLVKENQTFEIDHAKVQYFSVIHSRAPAFGIKFKDGKFLAYIPDFNRILPSSQKVIRDCHLLIIDGSSLSKIGQSPGHISIQDGIVIGKRLKAKSIYFVHIGHKTGTHQFLEKYLRKNGGPNFHIAFDGLEINL